MLYRTISICTYWLTIFFSSRTFFSLSVISCVEEKKITLKQKKRNKIHMYTNIFTKEKRQQKQKTTKVVLTLSDGHRVNRVNVLSDTRMLDISIECMIFGFSSHLHHTTATQPLLFSLSFSTVFFFLNFVHPKVYCYSCRTSIPNTIYIFGFLIMTNMEWDEK